MPASCTRQSHWSLVTCIQQYNMYMLASIIHQAIHCTIQTTLHRRPGKTNRMPAADCTIKRESHCFTRRCVCRKGRRQSTQCFSPTHSRHKLGPQEAPLLWPLIPQSGTPCNLPAQPLLLVQYISRALVCSAAGDANVAMLHVPHAPARKTTQNDRLSVAIASTAHPNALGL